MKYFKSKRSSKSGVPPGTPFYIGEERLEKTKVDLITYDLNNNEKIELRDISKIKNLIKDHKVNWLQIHGVHDSKVMETLGNKFDIHPLMIEDIMNTSQRTKLEISSNFILINLKKLTFNAQTNDLESEQISLILNKHVVISFHEKSADIFHLIIDRIMQNQGKIRKMGKDYLFYTLLDTIVDDYFITLEKIGNNMDKLEEKISENPSHNLLKDIQINKRHLINLRKSVFPLREAINKLTKGSHLLRNKTIQFIKDIYDHTIQIIETVESYRDINTGLKDMYLSSVSHKTNQVIQVLTMIATIFIPLTFISGIYGMNFKHIPELQWKYGYYIFWGIVLTVASSLLLFFKRKKWM